MAHLVQITDENGDIIGATSNAIDVNIKSGATLEVNLDPNNDGVEIYGSDDGGTTQRVIKTDAQGEPQVDIVSSALPTGAATELKQDDAITQLTSIAGEDFATETTLSGVALETGGNLATVKTNTDSLVTAGGGGYVRQDSTATIAKEAGGNLASIKTNTDNLTQSFTNIVDARKVYVDGAWRTITKVKFDVSATTTSIVAAVADQKIYVVGLLFTVDTDSTTLKLTENTVGDLFDAMTFMKGGGMLELPGKHSTILWETTTVNKALDITTVTGKATGMLWYLQYA